MKYRKKSVVVEAVQFVDTEESILKLSELGLDPVQIDYDVPDSPILKIETLEGLMIATEGDYIIKGVQGEFYPCKPDIFAETYKKNGGIKMLEKAKQLASQEFSRLSGREIKAEECFIVWFSKTLQNWKALVSTNAISSNKKCGDYAEITHNGDKKETYVDVYAKVSNRAIKD